MLVELAACFPHCLIRTAARRRGTHDLSDGYLGCAPVISRDAATNVALGNDPDQLAVLLIVNHGRASAP